MSFDSFESSTELGDPVNLYLFRVGPNPADALAYTDAEAPITLIVEGIPIIFGPLPMDRDNIKSSGRIDKTTLETRMPRDCALVDLYKVYPPSYMVSLVIYSGHLSDPAGEFKVMFAGRVRNVALDGMVATVSADPVSSILARAGLRRNWQYGCMYVLYGTLCQAQRVPRSTLVGSVLSGVSVRVTPVVPFDKPFAKFLNGTVEWTNADDRLERRNISAIVDAGGGAYDLTLTGSTSTIEAGQTMDMLLGCAHDTVDCETVFNNLLNFGGQPWIPLSNPVGNIATFF